PEVDKHMVEDGLPGQYATIDEDVVITVDVVVKTGLDGSTKEVLPVVFLLGVIITINKVVDALESLVRLIEGDKGGQWAFRIFHLPEQTGPVDETVVVVIDLISGSSSFVGHVFFGLVNIVVVEVRIYFEQLFLPPIMQTFVIKPIDPSVACHYRPYQRY